MRTQLFHAICAGLALALLSASVPSIATAQSAGKTIEERRALMKNNGGHLKAIAAFVKKGKGTMADVAMHGEAIAANAKKMAALFPKGTGTTDGVGKTRALPAIWADFDKFKGGADNLNNVAMQVASAARSGDKKAIGAAFGNLGKGCGGCHRTFRQPRKRK